MTPNLAPRFKYRIAAATSHEANADAPVAPRATSLNVSSAMWTCTRKVCMVAHMREPLPSTPLDKFVKDCRDRHQPRMTQADLANEAGISRNTVASIESGRTKLVPPATLNSIARALNRPVEEFLEQMGYEVGVLSGDQGPSSLDVGLTHRVGQLSREEQQALARIADELIDLRRPDRQ